MKKRYKKLREILDQCEMRDKAEIIVENEKLKVVMFLLHVVMFNLHAAPAVF